MDKKQKLLPPSPTQSTSVLRKLLSTLKIWPTTEVATVKTANIQKTIKNEQIRFKDLHELYKPLDAHDDNRTLRLNETIELLEKFQRAAMNYVLNINELAREYLLKARYREDKENFFNSFKLERSHYKDNDLWQYSKNC